MRIKPLSIAILITATLLMLACGVLWLWPLDRVPKGIYQVPYTNAVPAVERHIKENLADVASYSAIGWSRLERLEDGTYRVGVRYRARKFILPAIFEEEFTISPDGEVSGP